MDEPVNSPLSFAASTFSYFLSLRFQSNFDIAITQRLIKYFEPNCSSSVRLSLRRTLVQLNGDWSMVNEVRIAFIDNSPLLTHDKNVQVSDTTTDDQRTKVCIKK